MTTSAFQAHNSATAYPGVYRNITETIGCTPLVALSRLTASRGLSTNLLGKIEYFNPAGSIKDRPAKAMIDALVASDGFNENTEIVEATSGNNGVACAWLCAIYGIKLTIVIPEHMSIERRKLIRHYGANVVTTPKSLGTKGAIDKAKCLLKARPNAVMLDQFANAANPNMHFHSTAQEIWRDTGGNIDVFVAGVGTGGTVTGVGQALKALNPNIKVIAVEPASCPVLTQGRSGVHKIQGLSSGHVPDVLDTGLLDEVIAIEDEEAIHAARTLARVEGLPVGISSGAAATACLNIAERDNMCDKTIVTILADTAERYFSTDLFEDE